MELFITLTKGMGLAVSHRVLAFEACSAHPASKVFSLDTPGCSGDSRGKYIILCESRGQRALNGSVLLLETAYLT